MNPAITIVSACDRNFLWGAYLLVASAARNVPGTPVHLLQTGFSEEEIALIRQFPDARLLPLANDDPRCVANRKAEALLSADFRNRVHNPPVPRRGRFRFFSQSPAP